MTAPHEAWLLQPGRVPYRPAWAAQQRLAAARAEGRIPDVLILLEHPHTFTLGRKGDPANILADEDTLRRLGVEVVAIDRGGDVTYHGPGQIVGYPILDLAPRGGDVHQYLRDLEEVNVRALARFGIDARPGLEPPYTGAWVGEDKIAAIGVKVRQGITQHGFALNVNTDLRYFELIVPCGIRDKGVTSMARVLGCPLDLQAVAAAVREAFADLFAVELRPVPWEEALAAAGDGPAVASGSEAGARTRAGG
ncbi:MAG: lipoyl(octanoyl) transferase LipB [Firmicutes bacterium]|nr:lipoyl(octanoyl) transferase LipB [Bacillota bacterium]MBE3590885.1 lipoyl(octanoyl) transferase LipB [Bacillota bacterium]